MSGRRLIMVDILTAVLIDGLPAVEAACAEALAEGVHSADEQRDPVAPVPDLFEVGFPRAAVVKRGSMPPYSPSGPLLKLSREEKYGCTCSTRWLPMT